MDDLQIDDAADDVEPAAAADPAGDDGAGLAQYLEDIRQANDQFTANLPAIPTPAATYLQGGGPEQSGLPSTYFGNAANGPLMPFISSSFGKVPGQVTQDIGNFGTRLDMVPHSVADAEGLGDQPDGYPQGSTLDNVAGAYDPGNNTLILSTDGQLGQGSNNLALHELGHAYDSAMGAKFNIAPNAQGTQYMSNSPDFQAAYQADKKALAADDAGLEANYYVQPDDPAIHQSAESGRNEAFAESFANFYNGTQGWADSHPNLNQWFENFDSNQTPNGGAE